MEFHPGSRCSSVERSTGRGKMSFLERYGKARWRCSKERLLDGKTFFLSHPKHSQSAGSILLGGTHNELEKSVSNGVRNQSIHYGSPWNSRGSPHCHSLSCHPPLWAIPPYCGCEAAAPRKGSPRGHSGFFPASTLGMKTQLLLGVEGIFFCLSLQCLTSLKKKTKPKKPKKHEN